MKLLKKTDKLRQYILRLKKLETLYMRLTWNHITFFGQFWKNKPLASKIALKVMQLQVQIKPKKTARKAIKYNSNFEILNLNKTKMYLKTFCCDLFYI